MIQSKKHLTGLLGISIEEINQIVSNIDDHYDEYTKAKKRGIRIINPPYQSLKKLQKSIDRKILQKLKLPDYAFGAKKGHDNIRNAKRHQGKKYKFTTDLRNFFPSINHKMVYQMFLDNGFSYTVAHYLTKLTTYKDRVPQGAPTSSSIANLVFVPIGLKIEALAKSNGWSFTTFIDDVAISSPTDFKDSLPEIINLIVDGGFKISHNKTNYSRNPNITGLHPNNNGLRLPVSFMQKFDDLSGKSEDQIKGLTQYRDRVIKMNRKDYKKK